jgi:carbonic anhydrase/acetyltransferase-like protein (isoleucine patch superfamily)
VHPNALLYGSIHVAAGVSIWPDAGMRAEVHELIIGTFPNI